MIGMMPKFYDSTYFVDEPGNWHLKDGAPDDIREEFDRYMKSAGDIQTGVSENNDAVEAYHRRREERMSNR